MEFYFSTRTTLVREVGYVALTPQIYELAKTHFAERKVGTAFGAARAAGRRHARTAARQGAMSAVAEPGTAPTGSERGSSSSSSAALFLCALLSIVTTVGIIVVLAVETIAFFREVSLVEFLTDTEWTPLFADAALRHPAARRRHDAHLGDRDRGRAAGRAAQRRST